MPLPLAAAGDPGEDAVSSARYSSQASEEELRLWQHTFKQFDRDGGGDVDIRELGLMLRHLGQTPSDAQMRLIIEEVDIDLSGTIDFEEFCLLMMRQQRMAVCPEWLHQMLHPPLFGQAPPGDLPSVATLNDGRYDAAQRIRRARRGRKTPVHEARNLAVRRRMNKNE